MLDFEDCVGFAEQRLQDELSDIVDRLAERRAAFVRAVMGVTVDDRLHVVEAVDRLAQPLRAEILKDRRRLALDRALDR